MTDTISRMKQKRGTASEWHSLNPILDDGEIGYEEDTHIFKIGDGVTHWNELLMPFIPSSKIGTTGDLIVGIGFGTSARLPRGETHQRLTVNPDGTLGWTDMPAPPETIVRYIEKAGDTYKTYSANLYADPDLTLSVESNTTYILEAQLYFKGANGSIFSTDIIMPAGAGGHGMYWGTMVSAGVGGGFDYVIANRRPFGSRISLGTDNSNPAIDQTLFIRGKVSISDTAGNVTIGWIQSNSSVANPIVMHVQSSLTLTKVN